MNDIIFIAMENWDEVWRRFQPLCAGFACRYPKCRILYVGLPRNVSHQLRHGKLQEAHEPALSFVADIPNLTILRTLKAAPDSLAWGLRLNEIMARMQLQKAIRTVGIRHPILYVNPHNAAHMAGRMGEAAVIYDIGDDWISMHQPEWLRRRAIAQDAALCRKADAVVVVSQHLFDLKQPLAANLHLIPNGVDTQKFDTLTAESTLPTNGMQWPKPVLGYLGTAHSGRIDVPLVENLARRLTSGSIVFLGPEMLSADEKKSLAATGKVLFAGVVEHSDVPCYTHQFDVCITPHQINPFTESNNPLKLWEYLACGKPIVSTSVAGFRDYPQFVRLADSAEDFFAAVQDALHEAPLFAEARRSEARRHSWDTRLNAIESVIETCLSRRAKATTKSLPQ